MFTTRLQNNVYNTCIFKKVSWIIRIIWKNFSLYSDSYIKKSSLQYIYSYVIYRIEVSVNYSKTHFNRLKNFLNRSVKLHGYSGSADIEDYKNLEIIQFNQIYERFVFCRLFNYLCVGNNRYLYERFNHAISTIFNLSNNFNISFIHSSKLFCNFHYSKLWNRIPFEKRDFQNILEI